MATLATATLHPASRAGADWSREALATTGASTTALAGLTGPLATASAPAQLLERASVTLERDSSRRCRSARYTKGALLGRGACKTVYHAFDEENGIEVAWNEISIGGEFETVDEKERERIFGEIRLLQQLKHKNILALHDWWLDRKNGNIVFITELLDGSLRSYRQKHKTVECSVIRRWAWQILQGLVYLHGHNPPIIHRDLKSDNILFHGASGTLKIGDLGFATFRAGFSGVMSVIGTPEFMAPELYEEEYDEQVDIYSFGLCLLELATLEYPYKECRNAAQIFKKVTAGIAPEGLARIQDRELKDFVLLCIQHDPNKRPEARQLLKHKFFEPCRAEGLLRKSLAPLATNSLGVSGGPNVPMTPTLPSIASMPHLPNMASGAGGPPLAPRPGSAAGGGAQDSGALARSNSGVWPPTAAAAAAVRAAAGERVSVDSAATADSADSMAMRIAAAAGSTGGGLVATNSVGVVSRPSLPPGYEAASGSNGGVQPVSRRPSAPANLEPISVSVHPTESGELGDDTMIYTPTVRDETTQSRNASTPGAASARTSTSGVAIPPSTPFSAGHKPNTEDKESGSAQRGRSCHSLDNEESSSSSDEDVLGELNQRVRLACRNHEDNMLAFSMSFVNHHGTRQKVGFAYDINMDTAREVADEMIENLSLNSVEAGYIASLIQREISRLGAQNKVQTVLPPGAKAVPGSVGSGSVPQSPPPAPAARAPLPATASTGPATPNAQQQGWVQQPLAPAPSRPTQTTEPNTANTTTTNTSTTTAPNFIQSSNSVPIKSALTQGLAQANAQRTASFSHEHAGIGMTMGSPWGANGQVAKGANGLAYGNGPVSAPVDSAVGKQLQAEAHPDYKAHIGFAVSHALSSRYESGDFDVGRSGELGESVAGEEEGEGDEPGCFF